MGPETPTFPDVQGVWRGRWNAQSCTATGGASPGACANQSGDFNLTVAQSGSALNGTLQACGGRVSVTANISQDGVVSLLTQAPVSGTPATTIGAWVANVNGPFMTAVFACSVQVGAAPQDALVMTATLDNVSRVSRDPTS